MAATLWPPSQARAGGLDDFIELTEQYKPEHPPLRTHSSPKELALAEHLRGIGAACYTAWWCPHCQEQREAFGTEAASIVPFVQCSAADRKEYQTCRDQDIDGYPQWVIQGQKYSGGYELFELAEISGFKDFPEEAFAKIMRTPEDLEYIWGKAEVTAGDGAESA